MPSGTQQVAVIQQATIYCQSFISQYLQNLPALLALFEVPQIQASTDLTKFWLLQSLCDILKDHERYKLATQSLHAKSELHQKVINILKEQPLVLLGQRQNLTKYALIVVLLIKWDFPESWQDAFQMLISIMQATQDLNIQKLYLRFIVQVLITMDEDLIERYDNQSQFHNEFAGKVKDGIREHAIRDICGLIQQALQNFELFDKETINDCLLVTAQLIDWNSLDTFEQIVLKAKEILSGGASSDSLKFKYYRKNALKVLSAVVDKGMDHQNKIQVLVSLQYNDLVESFKIQFRDRDLKAHEEEQEEEEEFFSQLSDSVLKVGQWSLELFQHQDKFLLSPEHLQHYSSIFSRLLMVSIDLLDTDKPKISRNIVEFLSFWLQAIKKQDALSDFDMKCLMELTRVAVSRLTYPRWFKFKKDDMSDYEEDYLKYRDELVTNIFSNLAFLKTFIQTLLQGLDHMLSQLVPGQSSYADAEIVLYLLYHLQSTIPSELRDKATDNPYCELIQHITKVDFLGFKHKAVNLMYLEISVRYRSYLFKVPGFLQHVISVIFSESGVRSNDAELAQRSTYILLRLCEKFLLGFTKSEEEKALSIVILSNSAQIIEKIYSNNNNKLKLRDDEANNLYSVMGLFVSSQNVDQSLREQTLQHSIACMCQKLTYFSQTSIQLDKLVWTMRNMNIFSKGFQPNQEIFDKMKQVFDQVLKQILQIMNQFLRLPEVCDQAFLYLQKCITLLRSDSLDYVTQLGEFYVKAIDFEGLEALICVLSFTITTLKYDSLSMVRSLFNILFNRIAQVQCPCSNTSDVDKMTLSCFSAFLRFASLAIDTLEYRNIEDVSPGFSTWLVQVYELHPEKSFKKAIAFLFKELVIQLTDLKYQSSSKEAIAQLLNLSKKSLNDQVEGSLKQNMVLNYHSLPQEVKTIMDQALNLSLQQVFRLNPAVLDDIQIIKGLSEIQITFVLLGFREKVIQGLSNAGLTAGIQNGSLIVQIIDEFVQSPLPQIKKFHDSYIPALKQIRGLIPSKKQ